MGIIDNKDSNTLVRALKSALQTARAIDIFTGYFFFSGFYEVAAEIKDIKVRIVVGMDIDPKIVAAKRITDDSDLSRCRLSHAPPTNTAKIQNYHDSFMALFNNSNIFDKERISGTLEVFFEKIKDGSLEIKMNLDLDHAKYYLVHNQNELSQDGANPGTRFMGSSNFTVSGLKGQGELNDRRIDPEDLLITPKDLMLLGRLRNLYRFWIRIILMTFSIRLRQKPLCTSSPAHILCI